MIVFENEKLTGTFFPIVTKGFGKGSLKNQRKTLSLKKKKKKKFATGPSYDTLLNNFSDVLNEY